MRKASAAETPDWEPRAWQCWRITSASGAIRDNVATRYAAWQTRCVLDLTAFQNLRLRGGFTLVEVRLTTEPLLDPLERAATAQTTIRGKRFHILLYADLDERELSVSLYHEVLEAATVAADHPPEALLDFNEAAFERAAQVIHGKLGLATPGSLNQMLVEFGF